MREFFREIVHALEEGRPVELVSIAASDGSTPRGAGAMMAVFPGGGIAGTIGGGNVEFECQRLAAELLERGAMPCGSSASPWETPPAWAWSAAAG